LNELVDWSEHSNPGVKYFSGQATYRTKFVLDPKRMGKSRWTLDLGRVEVMAQVKLNGEDLGILWKTPFQVEITDAVKSGENILEVTVANLWPNRLIGDQLLPPEERITWTTWSPYTKDSPLLESGLLGPVCCRTIDR
jgi:beta-galactosidase/beta-glucuronidase